MNKSQHRDCRALVSGVIMLAAFAAVFTFNRTAYAVEVVREKGVSEKKEKKGSEPLNGSYSQIWLMAARFKGSDPFIALTPLLL